MALIKQANSTAASRDAIVLNLGDLRREAERMRDEAFAERDRILSEARAERDRIMAGASEAGYDAGYARGLEQGTAKGESEGGERAYDECRDRVKAFEESFETVLAAVEEEREQVIREAKSDLLLFACAFAERVTKRVIELDHTVVDTQLEAALKLVLGSTRLTVAIHPDDREVAGRIAPVIARRRICDSPVEFVEDEALARGSVVLRTDKGMIDATVDTQIERIVSALLGTQRLDERIGPDRGDDPEGEVVE